MSSKKQDFYDLFFVFSVLSHTNFRTLVDRYDPVGVFCDLSHRISGTCYDPISAFCDLSHTDFRNFTCRYDPAGVFCDLSHRISGSANPG